MTKYGISEECAAIMESLGGTLRNATSGIDANSVKLGEKVGALNSNGRLGIFGDEILNLTNGNRSAVQKVGEDIGVISKKAGDTAGRIRELVSAGLVAPAGSAAGSAGSTANISNGGSVSAKSGMSETANNKFADSGNGYEKNGSRTASEAAFDGSNNYSGSGTANLGGGTNNYVGSEFVNPFENSNNGENNFIKSENLDAYLKPETGATPRSLEKTQLGYRQTEDNCWVYDSPEETSKYLIQKQGQAYEEYQGTCGLCSCANALRQAGVNVSEKEIIDYASKTPLMGDKNTIVDRAINEQGEAVLYVGSDDGTVVAATVNDNGEILGAKDIFLCENDSPDPDLNGTSCCLARKQILEHFGIKSEIEKVEFADNGEVSHKTIENIAGHISEGKGVILSVDAGIFWDNSKYAGMGHSVTVTSVKKDAEGNVLGFYICDTGEDPSREPNYYSAEKIRQSLYACPINVTQIIR